MSESVYAAIGGQGTIEAVVKDFYQMVCYDHQLNQYFEETDMESLRDHQIEFLSMVTGGPVDYTGAEMRTAHAELDITDSEFTLVTEYLERALSQNGVSETYIDEILSTVATFKSAILDQ
jgi:hemoglobin